jgi:glutamate synthase (NADPH/NADH) large chain
MIEKHARFTGSVHAQSILDQWATRRLQFVKVFPKEYRRALSELAAQGSKAAA